MELEKDDQHSQVDSEEESDPTIVPRATYTKSYQCMNCFTDESKIWRRSPSDFDRKRKVFHKVLCDDCGIYWLKYAKTKPIAPEKKSANSTPTLSIMMTAVDEDRKRKRSTDIVKAVTKKHRDTVSYSPFRTTCTHGLNIFFFSYASHHHYISNQHPARFVFIQVLQINYMYVMAAACPCTMVKEDCEKKK